VEVECGMEGVEGLEDGAYEVKVAIMPLPPVAGEVAELTGTAATAVDDLTTTGAAADEEAGEEGKLDDWPVGGPSPPPFPERDPVPATGAALDTAEDTVPASAREEVTGVAPVAVGSMGSGSAATEELEAAVASAPRETSEEQGLWACSSHLPLWWW
jgi:hypothetical protein